MYQSKTILISIILSLSIGLSLGFYYGKQSVPSVGGGVNNAFNGPGVAPFTPPALPANMEIRSVSGTLKEIKGNILVIESPSFNDPTKMSSYSVTITNETKLTRQKQKTAQELQKEFDAFQKAMQSPGQKPGQPPSAAMIPPMPFTEVSATLKDLKVGDRVTAEANENIRSRTSFDAVKILIADLPSMPPVPPLPANLPAANITSPAN